MCNTGNLKDIQYAGGMVNTIASFYFSRFIMIKRCYGGVR